MQIFISVTSLKCWLIVLYNLLIYRFMTAFTTTWYLEMLLGPRNRTMTTLQTRNKSLNGHFL